MFELSHTLIYLSHLFFFLYPLYNTPGKFANNKLSQSQANTAIDEKEKFPFAFEYEYI